MQEASKLQNRLDEKSKKLLNDAMKFAILHNGKSW